MFTTREVGLDEHNNLVFQEKIDLELSNAKRKQLGLGTTDKEILSIRQAWEQIANTKWIETLHQHNQRLEYDYRVEKRHRESTFFGIGAMLRKENSEQKRYNE